MNIDADLVRVLADAGGVGVALASLGLVAYTLRLITNHLAHLAEAVAKCVSLLEIVERRLNGRGRE